MMHGCSERKRIPQSASNKNCDKTSNAIVAKRRYATGVLSCWMTATLVTPLRLQKLLDVHFTSPSPVHDGSLVIPGIHNSMIFWVNKEYPYRSNWILWNKCVTFKIP